MNALRADSALTVSLVAEIDGTVAGHIAFSPMQIDERNCPWYILGPIGVLPEHQRRGLGKELVREGLKTIRSLGAEGCGLVGDPAYYTRFGFRSDPRLTMEGVPAANLMCLPFTGQVPSGRVTHHAAFWVTA